MSGLGGQLSLSAGRELWPHYLFHTTDIENAVSIIAMEALHSRDSASKLNVLAVDSAHQEIIAHTSDDSIQCARLYFRPRTPTHYRTEGFRPTEDPNTAGHGIPVTFVFDALEVLTRETTRFTDGNAGSSRSQIGTSADFLESIPFQLVYHDGSFQPEERDAILFRRNAEVLVPGSLGLSGAIQFIMLRTEAERETLLARVEEQGLHTLRRYRSRVRVNRFTAGGSNLFFREWTFIEQVTVADGKASISFSRDTKTPGPFRLHVTISAQMPGEPFAESTFEIDRLNGTMSLALPSKCSEIPFILDLKLNGRQAFRRAFTPFDAIMLGEASGTG